MPDPIKTKAHFGLVSTDLTAVGQLNSKGGGAKIDRCVGVWGIAGTNSFVQAQQADPTGPVAGVFGVGDGNGVAGVLGRSGLSPNSPDAPVGVWGDSQNGYGVYGSS